MPKKVCNLLLKSEIQSSKVHEVYILIGSNMFVGSCHCKKVRFQIETENIFEDLYRCNCSLCRKKSIVMKPISQERFTLLEGVEYLSLYKWNRNIAEHYFCKVCGVYTHHKRRRYPDQIAVNFACLDDLDLPKDINIGLVDGASHD